MVARRFGAMRFSNWTAAWVAFGLGLRLFHYLRDPSVWHDEAFLILNVLVGVLFLPRALELIAEVRRARASGTALPEQLLTDPSDP